MLRHGEDYRTLSQLVAIGKAYKKSAVVIPPAPHVAMGSEALFMGSKGLFLIEMRQLAIFLNSAQDRRFQLQARTPPSKCLKKSEGAR